MIAAWFLTSDELYLSLFKAKLWEEAKASLLTKRVGVNVNELKDLIVNERASEYFTACTKVLPITSCSNESLDR